MTRTATDARSHDRYYLVLQGGIEAFLIQTTPLCGEELLQVRERVAQVMVDGWGLVQDTQTAVYCHGPNIGKHTK